MNQSSLTLSCHSSSFTYLCSNYLALNRPDAKDTDIENIRDTLVDSLFSFLVTLGKIFCTSFVISLVVMNDMTTSLPNYCLSGTVPVIRCPRGNAAEIVSEVLFSKNLLCLLLEICTMKLSVYFRHWTRN
jgi:hypothetical protein